jgi:hypothetical protein
MSQACRTTGLQKILDKRWSLNQGILDGKITSKKKKNNIT